MSTKYETVIGLEVHVQLNTNSKIFCGCSTEFGKEPNENTCPVCLGLPGTLPVLNKKAVDYAIMAGLALNCDIAEYSKFDRKNYFYPDLPKAYQISQFDLPIAEDGNIEIETEQGIFNIGVTRVHLEEDAGKLIHEGSIDKSEGSLVDYNRTGVPLIEIVSEPDIRSPREAYLYLNQLKQILVYLGINTGNMEEGALRADANVSVRPVGRAKFGTKTEVKNLNSFRNVEKALEYEIKRQTKALKDGEEIIQETRGWNDEKGQTFSQRIKENSDDYRYFPDPDIPKIDRTNIPEFQESRIDDIMPKLPGFKRDLYINLGLTSNQIEIIIGNQKIDRFFTELLDRLTDESHARMAANYVTSDLMGHLEAGYDLSTAHPDNLAELIALVSDGTITSRVAKDLLKEAVFDGIDVAAIASERGLTQQNSEADLMPIVATVISENESVVADYKAGKEQALKFLVGQGMKATKGSANPQLLEKLLQQQISTDT